MVFCTGRAGAAPLSTTQNTRAIFFSIDSIWHQLVRLIIQNLSNFISSYILGLLLSCFCPWVGGAPGSRCWFEAILGSVLGRFWRNADSSTRRGLINPVLLLVLSPHGLYFGYKTNLTRLFGVIHLWFSLTAELLYFPGLELGDSPESIQALSSFVSKRCSTHRQVQTSLGLESLRRGSGFISGDRSGSDDPRTWK